MLKGLTTPKLSPQAAPSHEDIFMQRYERLLRAARRLTSGSEKAPDLVHNAFVQFVLSRPDLNSIHDLDGYLLIMLRNMNVSLARRSAIIQTVALSAADYDSAEAGLLATNAHAQLQVREQLSLICQYACQRKERSKVGSALILRFFHGYYPGEVAQVFRGTRDVADKLLSLARHEALAYVEDPSSLKLIEDQSTTVSPDSQVGASLTEFLRELRHRIFLARTDNCRSQAQLMKIYSDESGGPSTEHLSHIVSCCRCLDEINSLLDLPSLADRFPMETLGRDPKPPSGSGPGDDGGGGMSGAKDIAKLKQVSRRRMTDVLEHRPKELRVAVNGYVLGSQSVSAELNKLALSVNLNERVGFVEVFSEQGLCLMFSNIGAPPDGALEQEAHVELSEGRTLDLNLNFTGAWPTVDVVYHDPMLSSDFATRAEDIQTVELRPSSLVTGEVPTSATVKPRRRALAKSRESIADWGFWLRPGAATAVVAILVISGLLSLNLRPGPETAVTATELLSRASAVEDGIADRTDQVLHRTLSLEERGSGGEMIARRKIEVWQSAEKGITARRLYDERGQLIAGDWRRSDGVQTLYHHGRSPKLQIRNAGPPDGQPGWGASPQSAVRNFEDVWQLDTSAKEFARLIGSSDDARIEEQGSSYIIHAEVAESLNRQDGSARLVKASLVLSRADLHAIEETLVVQQGDEVREYRFREVSFERHAPSTVAPSVFEPEPELLSSATPETPNSKLENTTPSSTAISPMPHVASADLEVEVLRLLNQVSADLGEQIFVTRTPKGPLKVQGLVATDARKREILNGLSSVMNEPAVKVEIATVAEALAEEQRRTQSGKTQQGPLSAQRFEIFDGEVPVRDKLRAFFGSDQAANDFAARMIGRSRSAMSRAGALKRLVGQLSLGELRELSPDARAKWLNLIRSHARAFAQETAALRQDLSPVFGGEGGGSASAPSVDNDAELIRAVTRLFELGAANDRTLRTALSINSDGTGADLSADFFRSLRNTEALARRIQDFR